jgi:Lysylphosphatidylglycerol synthase TM region
MLSGLACEMKSAGGKLRKRMSRGSAAAGGLVVLAIAVALLRRESFAPGFQIDFRWIALLAAAKCSSLALKNVRWRRMLWGLTGRFPSQTIRALASAYLLNLLLPFRAGELVRLSVVKEANSELKSEDIVATIGAEHLLDAVFLASLFGLTTAAIARAPASVHARGAVALVPLGVAIGTIAIVVTVVFRRYWQDTLTYRVFCFMRKAARQAASLILRPVVVIEVLTATLVGWSCDAAAIFAAAHASGMGLRPVEAAWAVGGFNLGLAISTTPGQLGAHQALAVLLLVPLGATVWQALEISVTMQAANILVFGSFGYGGVTGFLRQVPELVRSAKARARSREAPSATRIADELRRIP